MGYREAWAAVDLDALEYNYQTLATLTNKEIFAVVKGNAYGHGDLEIARALADLKTPYLCVSSIDEALRLAKHGITHDILIFSYVDPKAIRLHGLANFIYTISSMAWFDQVKDIPNLRLHLEVNTGMNRMGLKRIEDILTVASSVTLEGIYTHFQSPDNLVAGQAQLDLFATIVKQIDQEILWKHVGNAPMALISKVSWINGVRIGLGLYGYRVDVPQLRPVLSLYARIQHIDVAKKDETIGYDYTYTVTDTSMIFGTMPIGYADGFNINQYRLPVKIGARSYDIVGKICMDQTMIRLDDRIALGDVVTLIAPQRTLQDISAATQQSPYVILTSLNDRITRIYMRDGKVVATVSR